MSREKGMAKVRVTVRIPETVYAEVRSAAQENGWSINDEVVLRLGKWRQSDIKMTSEWRQSDVKVMSERHQSDVKVTPPQASSPSDAIEEADAMDTSGDLMRRDSPAQARRKAQIAALQEAWTSLLPSQAPLQDKRAKEWLQLTNNCAGDAYKVLEATAERQPPIDYPVAYIQKALERLKEKRDTEQAKVDKLEQEWERARVAAINDPEWGGWNPEDAEWAE